MSRSLLALVVAVLTGCPPKQVAPPPELAKPKVAAPVDTGASSEIPTLRLPREFRPASYSVRLDIDPAKTTFEGSIAITGFVDQPTPVIWLHGYHLKVSRATATNIGPEIPITVTPRGEDLLELRPARPLARGEWTLMLDYTGEVDVVSTSGMFKQVVQGNAYVYTQLEALYARRVFPCIDEPDSKVPWKLTLDVPAKLVAVSNTPIASEAPIAGDKRRVEFAQTKPLPSYLVAFGVGPFEIVDGGKTKGGTPVRIVTLAGRAADGAWAAQTTARLLEITEDWFGTPYPYEKLDMLSIPLTVGFGAMENAGLITWSETLMLIDPKSGSKARKNTWVVVAAHEIAHQWFGNLVTMGFWDDIWLNEGFANWMETKTAATFDPPTHDDYRGLEQRNAALRADSLVSARQIRQPIKIVDDILTAFDGITYDKGASVLRMIEQYVGPAPFQQGVRDYIRAKAYGNATSADFAAAISKAANKDVAPILATFLDQAGAPELVVGQACGGTPSISVEQHRYLPAGSPRPAATKPWMIPVCVAYEKQGKRAEACTLVDEPTDTLSFGAGPCPRWVMPNANGAGYYRVAYTAAQLATLRDDAWPELTWPERRAIFSDVIVAVGQGKAPLMLALSFVPKMVLGNDRFTLPTAVGFPAGYDAWIPSDLRSKFEYYLRTTFGPAALAAGLVPKDSDTLDLESTRGALIGTVAWAAREPKLVEQAVGLAEKWRDLPQATRGLVLDIAVDASPVLFAKILKEVRTEPDRARRQEMYDALGGVRDAKRQAEALALLLDPKLDIRETLAMVEAAVHEENHAVVRQFWKDHEKTIFDRLPKGGTAEPAAAYAYVFTSACRADQRDEIAAYVRKTFTPLSGGARVVDQAIESMNQCIAKRAVVEPQLRGWLTGVKIAKNPPKADPKPETKPKAPKKPGKKPKKGKS